MVGIIIGVAVNLFHLPRTKQTDILFISGLDDTLLNSEYHLNDITFGTIPSKYDYVVCEGDTNEVVHKMKKIFQS